jgi:hypothetical protein
MKELGHFFNYHQLKFDYFHKMYPKHFTEPHFVPMHGATKHHSWKMLKS